MKKIIVILVMTLILSTILMLVNLSAPEKIDLNAMIYDKDIIDALKIEELDQNTDTISTETTIKFKVKNNEISADGYFTYYEARIYISANGEYKTDKTEGIVNEHRSYLDGEMEVDGLKWDILIGYSEYDDEIKYEILVHPTIPSEFYTVFKFNYVLLEPIVIP